MKKYELSGGSSANQEGISNRCKGCQPLKRSFEFKRAFAKVGNPIINATI
jgi:hypothetical protein